MNDAELRALALIGARARLIEIDEERARLLAAFPQLVKLIARKVGRPRKPASTEPAVIFDAGEDDQPRARTIANKRANNRGGKPGTRRRHSAEIKAEVVKRVKAGEYVRDLSREYGVNDSMIRRWSEIAGVTPKIMPRDERIDRSKNAGKSRSKRAAASKPRGAARADKREALLLRVAEGEEINATALDLGVNQSTARGWVARHQKEEG
jgi:transposase-like protein